MPIWLSCSVLAGTTRAYQSGLAHTAYLDAYLVTK